MTQYYLFVYLALFAAVRVAECGTNSKRQLRQQKIKAELDTELRIIGGVEAEKDKFPFAQVSLQTSHGIHQCGGSLIAPDIVMTAGHCFGFFSKIQVNRYDFSNQTEEVEIFSPAHYTFHPQFEEKAFRYDILLIQLTSQVKNVEPVLLNSATALPRINDELTVLGWGLMDTTDHTAYPDTLHHATVKSISNSECASSAAGHYQQSIHAEMLCAIEKGQDACAGDSGGPLVEQFGQINIQIGIVSWGRGCAGQYPGVYTRISFLFDWIKTNVCATSESPPAYFRCPTLPPVRTPTNPPTSPPTRSPTPPPTNRRTPEPTIEPPSSSFSFSIQGDNTSNRRESNIGDKTNIDQTGSNNGRESNSVSNNNDNDSNQNGESVIIVEKLVDSSSSGDESVIIIDEHESSSNSESNNMSYNNRSYNDVDEPQRNNLSSEQDVSGHQARNDKTIESLHGDSSAGSSTDPNRVINKLNSNTNFQAVESSGSMRSIHFRIAVPVILSAFCSLML